MKAVDADTSAKILKKKHIAKDVWFDELYDHEKDHIKKFQKLVSEWTARIRESEKLFHDNGLFLPLRVSLSTENSDDLLDPQLSSVTDYLSWQESTNGKWRIMHWQTE